MIPVCVQFLQRLQLYRNAQQNLTWRVGIWSNDWPQQKFEALCALWASSSWWWRWAWHAHKVFYLAFPTFVRQQHTFNLPWKGQKSIDNNQTWALADHNAMMIKPFQNEAYENYDSFVAIKDKTKPFPLLCNNKKWELVRDKNQDDR